MNKISTKPITRNSQAIRWCRRYEMDISFRDSWREVMGSNQVPANATCRVMNTRLMNPNHVTVFPMVFGNGLIDCVNQMIKRRKESEE